MIVYENNQQSLSTEVGSKSNIKQKSIKSDLNPQKEISDNLKSNYFEEIDSLKYDSSYKAIQSDNQKNVLRKSSTLSTNISQSEINSDNISPKKNIEEKDNSTLFINFNRERFNSMPISNYFDGIDNYFKGLYPQQNNYQKSKNYLEKKYFLKLREHFPSVDIDYIYNKKNDINNNNIEIFKKKEEFSNQKNCAELNQTYTPISNNCKISQNIPMYYFGFCSIDCKL